MTTVSRTIAGLVSTKLSPPRANYVMIPREELIASLRGDGSRRVALICAPAGYGKTTLASLFVASIDRPHAWLSLDPNDDTLPVFLTYLIASIESACPGACMRSRAGLAATDELSDLLLADRLLADLTALDTQLVLVLDDYHVIQDLAIHQLLGRLIKRMPATLQIVIVSRMDPPLPLSRLRGHGELVEIRGKQLRFSQAESEAYLRRFSTLPSSILDNLVKKSEGWPVGLNLLALSASSHPDVYLPSTEQKFDGNSLIADYFFEEVLQSIPEREQLLLFSTALPDRFSPPVCQLLARVLEVDIDVHKWLSRLFDTHLFMRSLDLYGNWYNYHQLFREFLLVQLRRTQDAEAISQLYLNLSDWFYERQYMEEALQYALAAGDVGRAAEIVEMHASVIMAATDWRRLGVWLKQLPESTHARPGIQVCFAYQMHFRHRRAVAAHHLDAAEAALVEQDYGYTEPQLAEIQGSIWALRAQHIAADRPVEAQAMARRALELLPKKCRFQRSNAEIAICSARYLCEPTRKVVSDIQATLDEIRSTSPSLRSVRLQLMICGGFYQAADLLNLKYAAQELLKQSEQTELPFARGWAEYALGWTRYQQNDLVAAERHFLAIWQNHDLYHGRPVVDALTGLVLIYRLRANEGKRTAALRWLEQFVRQHDLTHGITVADALQWLAEPTHAKMPPPHGFVVKVDEQLNALLWMFPVLVAVRQYVALGDLPNLTAAAGLIEQCAASIHAQRDVRILVELRCCQALLLDAQGERDAALQCLEEAVSLAAGRGAYRLIADNGPTLAPLLQKLLARHVEPEFVTHVLSLLPPPAPAAANGDLHIPQGVRYTPPSADLGSVDLTPRELEVLLLLAKRFSDKEIAGRLKLSTRTVQKHTTNIYQKLQVNGRRQAVTRARSAGLIA